MDPRPMSPNSPSPAERPLGVPPEGLQSGAVRPEGATQSPEAASQPGAGPDSGAQGASSALPPKLTAADVAAAIAAVPGPSAPGVAMPTAAPAVAADVDVIEPEWVAKAEEVVQQHEGDPYGEEEAIEDLQQDYLLKRYGHKVADPNADSSKPEGK